jgi:hypothetical protein
VSNYADCRKYAAYCLEMAEATKSVANRIKYLQLAQAWLSEAISQSPLKEHCPLSHINASGAVGEFHEWIALG